MRTICFFDENENENKNEAGDDDAARPVFFDMKHSNNAARIRLWMRMADGNSAKEGIDTKTVQYADLKQEASGTFVGLFLKRMANTDTRRPGGTLISTGYGRHRWPAS